MPSSPCQHLTIHDPEPPAARRMQVWGCCFQYHHHPPVVSAFTHRYRAWCGVGVDVSLEPAQNCFKVDFSVRSTGLTLYTWGSSACHGPTHRLLGFTSDCLCPIYIRVAYQGCRAPSTRDTATEVTSSVQSPLGFPTWGSGVCLEPRQAARLGKCAPSDRRMVELSDSSQYRRSIACS